MSGQFVRPKYPWMPDGEIVANLAIGNLRENFLAWLNVNGRIHAETLLTSVGASAGMAAQGAVWARVRKGEKFSEHGFLTMQTKSGELFYFGDTLNSYLVRQDPNIMPLWSFVAAAVLQIGLPQESLPDTGIYFQRAASTAGTTEYHELTVPPENKPMVTPRKALEVIWPRVADILSFQGGPGLAAGKSVDQEHWSTILAIVARQLIIETKEVLKPQLAFQLVMQSAIIASKYDASKLTFGGEKNS
jgi:hypothetical protein